MSLNRLWNKTGQLEKSSLGLHLSMYHPCVIFHLVSVGDLEWTSRISLIWLNQRSGRLACWSSLIGGHWKRNQSVKIINLHIYSIYNLIKYLNYLFQIPISNSEFDKFHCNGGKLALSGDGSGYIDICQMHVEGKVCIF